MALELDEALSEAAALINDSQNLVRVVLSGRREHHSIEITNTIVLEVKFNLFREKSRFVSFYSGNITF